MIAMVAVAGFADLARAQEAAALFVEGDIVRGNTPAGLTGPVCVLTNQFKRKEKVVFRIRARDATGAPLDDKALKGIVVELSDGQSFAAQYRARPPLSVRKALGLSEPTDYFWSAVWLIPADYPTGSLSYRVVATDLRGHTQTWSPFKDPRSLPVVTAGDVEYTR
jgi:pimeloyl-ACP methyl ester carboxylesterase